jgi:hypothetical protein
MSSAGDIIQTEKQYFPATLLKWPSAVRKKSFAKVPFTTTSAPETICGIARRIGYTGSQLEHHAIYRLKLYTDRRNIMDTLPGWYILENGKFSRLQNDEHA